MEYAAGAEKNAARLGRLLAADCDILVLTETHDALALPAQYAAVASDQRPTAAAGGRWVTIWSRLPVRQLATKDPVRTVAAEVGGSTIVYGTVLPWHTDPGPAPDSAAPARNWSEFMRVTPLQAAEWRALRDEYPDSVLIIAGDLNQSLAAQRYYGTAATRQLLHECLHQADLTCFTDGAHFPQQLLQHPPIDHVCAAAPMGHVLEGTDWFGWEGTREAASRLSDHSGVAVTLRSTPRA
ncbi:endonuclease/exonuclease/phosphatase family protein [Geodermatophilus sp. SYSU D01176]